MAPLDEADADEKSAAAAAESIERRVAAFCDALTRAGLDAVRIQRFAAEVDRIGAAEIFGSSQVIRRVLAQDMELATSLAYRKGATAESLRTVRELVAGLDPSRFDFDGAAGRDAAGYAAKAARAERDMERPLGVLIEARSKLHHENAVIGQEERSLWLQMHALRGHARLTQRLDEELERRIARVRADNAEQARQLQANALFPIRRRRQDVLTHLAVAAQGYAALRVVERTNETLIRAIDTAVTTTVSAVRAAALAVRALTTAERVQRGLASIEVGEGLAAACVALDAVDRSKLTVLDAVRATLKTVHDDATSDGPGGGPRG